MNQPPPLHARRRKHEHRGKGKRQLEVQGEKYFPQCYERLFMLLLKILLGNGWN